MDWRGKNEGLIQQREGQGKDNAAGCFEGQAGSQTCYLYSVALRGLQDLLVIITQSMAFLASGWYSLALILI